MGKNRKKVLLSGLVSLFLWMFISCSSKTGEEQVLRYVLSTEPPELNNMRTTDSVSIFILGHIKEGLLTYGPKGELIPGVAERWEITSKKYRFYLRENARWKDGEAVTADDFVYAWRKVVDPKTASEYAFITYMIKNAEKCVNGVLPPESLGVRAIDERTLEVVLENPTGYFLSLMAFPLFFPVQKKVHEKYGEQ